MCSQPPAAQPAWWSEVKGMFVVSDFVWCQLLLRSEKRRVCCAKEYRSALGDTVGCRKANTLNNVDFQCLCLWVVGKG